MIPSAYTDADAERWDRCVARSPNGTFLHTRRYLGYHGTRFADASLVLESTGGELKAVFAAAADPADPHTVVSHPGLTFGGLVGANALAGEAVYDALVAIGRVYAARGFRRLRYKAVPSFYQRGPCADDLHALFRLGAARDRCDLSATIDLDHPLPESHGRRQSVALAGRAGIALHSGVEHLPAFWEVLSANLAARHDTRPVHSIDEIARLAALFPEAIECRVAMLADAVVAGAVLYRHPTVLHCQYLAADDAGRRVSALDAVVRSAIASARAHGLRWFDFGTSTEDAGRRLNSGLYAYKRSFGAGSTLHEFHTLDLADFR
jgi:hypothetical protein